MGHEVRSPQPEPSGLTRRSFLQRAVLTATGCAAALAPWGQVQAIGEIRKLEFHHLHTNEDLSLTYYANGRYLPDALTQVSYFLRDLRSGEIESIDRNLLDLLFKVSIQAGGSGSPRCFDVLCGYRSPETNDILRHQSRRVAKHSLHTQGKAVDLRLPGVNTSALRRIATDLQEGGVGYYPRANFVHLDVGEFRTW